METKSEKKNGKQYLKQNLNSKFVGKINLLIVMDTSLNG